MSTVAVLVAITIVVFLIFFAIPGINPAVAMAGRHPDPATVAAIQKAFGLNKPLPVQYVLMMKHLFVDRNLVSYVNRGQLVIPQIWAAAPVSFSLVLGAAVIWVSIGTLMGVFAAVFHGRVVDPVLMALGLLGLSMPPFWLGELANLLSQGSLHHLAIFHWVPPPGYTPFSQDPLMWFKELVIPWFVLAVAFAGLYGRVLRSSLLEVMGEDHVRTARAKGLTERRIMVRHVLRMSMISFVSLFGLDFGSLVGGGVVLIEVVFGLPGIGLLTFQAASGLTLPTIMATVTYGAVLIVVANAVVDVIYVWLDPRMRPA